MTTTNWNDMLDEAAKSGIGEDLPADKYAVVVETATFQMTTTDKKMWKCRFNVTVGPLAGRKLFNNFVLSPESSASMGFFFAHMAALGLPREYFAASPSDEAIAAALVGRTAIYVNGPGKKDPTRMEMKALTSATTAAPAAPAVPAPPLPPAAVAPPAPPAPPVTAPPAPPLQGGTSPELPTPPVPSF